MTDTRTWLGTGIYSIPEASRLIGVSTDRIRRWLNGYTFDHDHVVRMPPVWRGQLPHVEQRTSLGFLDLMEARIVGRLRDRGLTWHTLRLVGEKASRMFRTSHPFCTQRFKTDGRLIFAEVNASGGERHLLELCSEQRAFKPILDPYLYDTVEFSSADVAVRWWPLGRRRGVVLDPERAFGQPIVEREGVPTAVLYRAFRADGSRQVAAQWYGVSEEAVREAVEFESHLTPVKVRNTAA